MIGSFERGTVVGVATDEVTLQYIDGQQETIATKALLVLGESVLVVRGERAEPHILATVVWEKCGNNPGCNCEGKEYRDG